MMPAGRRDVISFAAYGRHEIMLQDLDTDISPSTNIPLKLTYDAAISFPSSGLEHPP